MNFKKTMLASLLMISASGAFAADSAELTIKGNIAPSSCDVTLTGGEIVVTGITRGDLSNTQTTELPSHAVSYVVGCEANAAVKFEWADEKAGSSTGEVASFGLGMQGDEKIGGYRITTEPGVVFTGSHSGTGHTSSSSDRGLTWRNDSIVNPANIYSFSDAARAGTPVPLDTAAGTFKIAPFIGPVANLDFTDGVELDGRSVMTVSYL